MENRLLFRRKCHTVDEDPTKKLLLPKKLPGYVITDSSHVPMAGHLGRKKIQDRFLCFFFWAGLYSDVAELCRSCLEYQRTA